MRSVNEANNALKHGQELEIVVDIIAEENLEGMSMVWLCSCSGDVLV